MVILTGSPKLGSWGSNVYKLTVAEEVGEAKDEANKRGGDG